MKTPLSIGSDPELFCMSKKTRKIVSAIPILNERDKDNKIDLGGGFEIFADNVLLEASMPPSFSTKETVDKFRELSNRVNDFLEQRGVTLKAQASHEFDEKELVHKLAQRVGCSPEYDGSPNLSQVMPPDIGSSPLRTGGGHIHIGVKDFERATNPFLLDPHSKIAVIRAMDVFVGLSEIVMSKDPTGPRRKKLYGKAGRHRPTPYGVEYRTTSNHWCATPQLVQFTDILTRYAVGVAEENIDPLLDDNFEGIKLQESRDIIDNNDKNGAKKLLKKILPVDLHQEMVALGRLRYSPILANNYK